MSGPSRREFMQAGFAGALTAGAVASSAEAKRPNFLVIICDQFGLDAIAAHGCPDVRTPNIDRLVAQGVTFLESHSTNPVCSPARSSLMTGRMPAETGVITNGRPIHPSVPNVGQWLAKAGYETVHCGKWHLPGGYPAAIPGFTVLPVGAGQGDLVDDFVSRSCEAWLKSRTRDKPFLLVASFMQPHDICYWAIRGSELVPQTLPFPHLADQLPKLPPNHRVLPPAPAQLARTAYTGFTDEQWRYYIYIYYRQVEMVDADIGRLLDALDDTGQAEDTIVLLTSDHGEGRGRHLHVQKWYPYDEGVKVPMIVACPGRVREGLKDSTHLVSGLDIMPTVCDFAGIKPPPCPQALSLRPLLEGRNAPWREFLVTDHHCLPDRSASAGHAVRTERFKYVRYTNDPVEQLFDMKADPWETRSLYQDPKYAEVVRAHRRLLDTWQAQLKPVPPTRDFSRPRPRKRS